MRRKNIVEIILMTGIFLQASCSMIVESSMNPDIEGSSTSVRTRSILKDFSFSISHALTPSEAAETAITNRMHKNDGKKTISKQSILKSG
jgi:hypothetical protein